MQVLVVYESMFGNTHAVADAVAQGLAGTHTVEVCAVEEAVATRVVEADAVVVGGPTHVHGMSWSTTRQTSVDEARARAAAAEEPLDEHLDEHATGEGLRTWFHHLPKVVDRPGASFDTRTHGPTALTGSAARGIAHRLRHHGFDLLVEPESFLVEDMDGPLIAGELDRARQWGEALAARLEDTDQRAASTTGEPAQ